MMPEQDGEQDPDDLPPGTALCGGRYVIEACLGRGGVATVYRVRTADGRRLALKLMVTRRAADDDQRERFDNEWRVLAALRGLPYVVGVDESGRHDDGRPFFTMQLVEGPTLADLIADRSITVTRACWVAREVAHALDDLHTRGVVHRDIKPDNIMVTPEGVRLLDFGYAYTRGSEQVPSLAGLTSSEHRPGTALYMAPEQADGEPPTPSFDLYALAVTLYEALVGHAPNSEIPPSRMMLYKCRGNEELSIEGRMGGLRPALVRLIDHGLRRKPAERVRSAAELRERLDAVLEQMGDEDLPAERQLRPERAAGVIEQTDVDETVAFLSVHRRVVEASTERAPLRPAIGGGRGETMPVPAAVAPSAEPTLDGLEIPEDLQVEAPEPTEDEQVELLALREAARRAAEQAKAAAAAKAEPSTVADAQRSGSRVASVGGSSPTKWVAAGAMLLLLGVGAWWELGGDQPQDDQPQDDRSPPAGSVTAAPEVEPAPRPAPEIETEPDTAQIALMPETKVAPEPESTVEPEPAPVKPGKPSRNVKPPRPPIPEPCPDVAAEAKAASRAKQWSQVLKLTKSSRCWNDDGMRVWLRVQALSELGRFADCAALGPSSRNPEAKRLAKSCATQLEQEKTP